MLHRDDAEAPVVIDRGLALGFSRHGLQPHPLQSAVGRMVRQRILRALEDAMDVVISHFHGDHVPSADANSYQLPIHRLPDRVRNLRCWCKSDRDEPNMIEDCEADELRRVRARFVGIGDEEPGRPVRVVLDYLCTGDVQVLPVDGRRFSSAIRKAARREPVALGTLGLEGDEQADPSAHGGLSKAVYAWPVQHWTWWHEQRRIHGVGSRNEALPHGVVGENLGLRGLDEPLEEAAVFVGDELHFSNAVLRVTEPRRPCFKFNAMMGYSQASRDMVLSGRSGFYLAVVQEGHLQAGEMGKLRPGPRALSIAAALHARRYTYLR